MHLKRVWLVFAAFLIVSLQAHAQGNQTRPLITQPVNESKLTELKGNTHPLARPEFDRGAAPADLPMDRMMLVLKRSPEQETALQQLLAEQTDKTSPNYHKWLTPEQFGAQFGPSDSDIQAVTSWLESHGFQIGHVAKARNIIEFSGNAAQVQQAFHTAIHKYLVNGEEHWANANDPQIPAALTPVVVGVSSLHNFLSKPLYHSRGAFTKSKATGEVRPANPALTFPDACGLQGDNCYTLLPYDFATIYNVLPLWNAASSIDGSGQAIAVVGRTDVDISDMRNFRIFAGLPAKDPNIIVNGTDPGTNKGDEGESDLDLQWAGGVARNATIDFVTSASTNTNDGVNISAAYIVDNNLAPIMSVSYGLCELELGTAGASSIASMWAQAAAQGITVSVATGDTGSALCEDPSNTTTSEQPATSGLAVSGLASTPNNIAVGGTDFNDFANQLTYWSTTNNSANGESAFGYIPETAYNDSCSNAAFVADGFSGIPETNCNNTISLAAFIAPFGGGGGASTTYLKPSYQLALTPADSARDMPDVSLFAGDGTIVGSAYIVCEADTGASCVATAQGTTFDLVGGTSASAQVFAGIMALVDQNAKGREGNANAVMYPLAATPPLAASCNSSGSPSTSCIFYDVTSGTNAMPCVKGTPNCVVNNGADANGILSGFNAGVGYDKATGLGSINAANFVDAAAWTSNVVATPDFELTAPSPTITVNSQGGSGTLTFTVTSINNYSGTFNLGPSICSSLPLETSCSVDKTSVSVSPGTPTATFTVTFKTTAPSMLTPTNRRNTPSFWPAATAVSLFYVLAFSVLVLTAHGKQRRWSTALALLAFALMLSISACGGGGNNGGGGGGGCGNGGVCTGGTPTGTTSGSVTITDSAANPTIHSYVFTLTVD